jgi:GNAT superfamily N-acetyltransferase/catechol 2,3-dioxygenase-like lactoylglutathione lyase family enzyme
MTRARASIRRATSADARGILDCLHTAFEPYRHHYTETAFLDTVLTAETIEVRLASMAIFVAVTPEGEIVGTIGCGAVDAAEGHIRGMAVLDEWQGCGLAASLLQAAEAELRGRGLRRVTLDTTQPLERAIAFYEKSGYRRSGKVGNFFGMPLFEYVKDLDGRFASLDHLILGVSDLERGIRFVEERCGVRAAAGGVHPGRGTHNALLALGPRCYLEILAPDPGQAKLAWFSSLPQLSEPRLVGWMARPGPGHLEAVAERLRQSGISCEGPRESSRQRPDGRILQWKLLRLTGERSGDENLLPFCIQWSVDSPHPADDAPSGLNLVQLEISDPNPEELQRTLAILGLDFPVARSEHSQLCALITGPKGKLELIS